MKPIYSLYFALITLMLVSCGESGSPNGFTKNVNEYLSLNHHEREFITHFDIDSYDTGETYKAGDVLVAPLAQTVQNSIVLDQGYMNASVTLSAMGSIGILLQEDAGYYNAACSLNLGNYLHYHDNYRQYPALKQTIEKNSLEHYPSGWRGSTLSIVLSQIETFGIIYGVSCGNDHYYDTEHTNMIDPVEYAQFSESMSTLVNSKMICSNYDSTVLDCQHTTIEGSLSPETMLGSIKEAIDSGALALISTAIFPNLDNNGLSKSYYPFNPGGVLSNVWDYTEEVKQCRTEDDENCSIVTHDLIVFGYIDDHESTENGLLVLRNSWGEHSGDGGSYYMTYEYAQKMLLAVHKLNRTKGEDDEK